MSNCFMGKRVRLRAMEMQDVELWVQEDQCRDSEKDRCDYMVPLPRAQWKLREQFPDRVRKESQTESFRFMIENLEGETVGSINAHDVDMRMGTFSYGLGIDEKHRRKGYASEAILLLMRYYFMELRLHKCGPSAYAFNEASVGLHERLGFLREGTLREVYYTHGKYWDLVQFGMTQQEFVQQYPDFSMER